MLYYSSLHPEWDYFGEFQASSRANQISNLLETIALTHSRNTSGCIERLEQLGIVLGNNSFEAALIQRDPLGSVLDNTTDWIQAVLSSAKPHLEGVIWYFFSCAGRLYILCCFPRLPEDSPALAPERQRLQQRFQEIARTLKAETLRILLSDMQSGNTAIFRCFNNLHHAMEYYDFRDCPQRLIQLDAEQQLHGAFIEDMSAYREFSVSIGDGLIRDNVEAAALTRQIVDAIIGNSAPSIESIHHHVQMFILTFTDYLGSSGLVNATYIRRHRIVYRAMGFEKEQELFQQMLEILEELRRQNRTLQRKGKQKRIQDVKEYVESHIQDPSLSVSMISERFHITAVQMSKQFRYYYGLSLSKFIQQTRFRRAQKLIEAHPGWTMAKIAEAAGYSDPSTMYRAFQQLGETTPGAIKLAAQLGALGE